MFRGVKSLVRSVDRLVRLSPPSARIKQPLRSLFGHASSFLSTHHTIQASAHNINIAQNISTFSRAPVHVRANLSLPVRLAVGRPLSGPFLPRAPTVPRHIAQVGLGTARNFSSSRPIFQNIADNVPIATRAFWEADWEVKGGTNMKTLRKKPSKKASKPKVADKLKADHANIPSLSLSKLPVDDAPEYAVSDYFIPSVQDIQSKPTTYLTIPLIPPERRRPLPVVDSIDLLPLPQLHDIHSAHELHAIKVESLFRRLEFANVWSRNVDCECYGGSEGRPKFLKLIFRGWSEAEVRHAVGEAINGWCTLESVEAVQNTCAPEVADISEPSFMHTAGAHSAPYTLATISESQEIAFVVPTLDFSDSTPTHSHFDNESNVWCTPSQPVTATPSEVSDIDYQSDGDFATTETWSSHEDTNWTDELTRPPSPDASWIDASTPWLHMSSRSLYL